MWIIGSWWTVRVCPHILLLSFEFAQGCLPCESHVAIHAPKIKCSKPLFILSWQLQFVPPFSSKNRCSCRHDNRVFQEFASSTPYPTGWMKVMVSTISFRRSIWEKWVEKGKHTHTHKIKSMLLSFPVGLWKELSNKFVRGQCSGSQR